MIDNSGANPTSDPVRTATSVATDAATLVDVIVREPDRVETGWTVLARDVDLGDDARLPVLALDASNRLVVVYVGGHGDAADRLLLRGLDCFRRVRAQRELLRKVISTIGRSSVGPVDDGDPRLVLITPRIDAASLQLAALITETQPTLIEYQFLQVGNHMALHMTTVSDDRQASYERQKPLERQEPLEPRRPHAIDGPRKSPPAAPAAPAAPPAPARPQAGQAYTAAAATGGVKATGAATGTGAGSMPSGDVTHESAPSDDHRARLLAEARSRILNLSPDITALEVDGGLTFRYRGHDLARFDRLYNSRLLLLKSSRDPDGRRILGRSDLEEALHGVIEEFFALYTGESMQRRAENPRAATARFQDARSGDARSGDARSGDARSGDARSGDAHHGDDGPPGAKPSDAGVHELGGSLARETLRAAPLTREEIDEFLRSDEPGNG